MQQPETIEAWPLSWPFGHERTKYQKSAPFNTSFAKARDGIINNIRLMGGRNIIMSSNIPVKGDGLPYASFRKPADPGVAVYFLTRKGSNVVFACDKWNTVEGNMQAINKTIEAMRGLDRWGVSDMLDRVFTGFKALPPNSGTDNTIATKPWYEVLGITLEERADPDKIKAAWRELIKKYHPDNPNTGNQVLYLQVQDAYHKGMSYHGITVQ